MYTLIKTVLSLLVMISLPVAALEIRIGEPIRPLPLTHDEDPVEVALGDQLFHDVRFSADNSVSCASCHDLANYGLDGLPRALGIKGREGVIKTPTVFNSRFNFRQFWDGRARTLEEQVSFPIANHQELDSTWEQILAKLAEDTEFMARFEAAYPQGLSRETVSDAVATFERTLITVNAPFDRWLRGDEQAISAEALQGYKLFKSYGCVSCHQGVNVGGNLFAQMGAMGDYFAERGGALKPADLGRFNVTGDELDKHFFKVPSLRLAAINRYFFHDASTSSLREAIRVMGRFQLGRGIPDEDIALIEQFLHSLLGEYHRFPAEKPAAIAVTEP